MVGLIMKNIHFAGIMPALVTPFDQNQKIKRQAVGELINMQLKGGVQGFYVCGNTGEGPSLRLSTRMEMLEAVVEFNLGRGKIIAHIGAPNILDAVELTKHATKAGVDGIASLPPTYNFKYSQDELVAYYRTIADNTHLPVMVYAHQSTGVSDYLDLMSRLMEIPSVSGLKCTLKDYYIMRRIKELNGGDINVINGPDETLLCGLTMGADGGIGSTYNIMPDWFCKLYQAYCIGDMSSAAEYQYKINQVITILIEFGVIRSVKATLSMMGFDVGEAAFPSRPLDAQERADLRQRLSEQGITF
jgi:N-acetylneuraminate lyase